MARWITCELGNLSRSGALLTFGSLRKPGWLSLGKPVEVGIIHPESGETVELSADRQLAGRCRELLVEVALDSYRGIEVLGSPAMVALAHLKDGVTP